MPFQRKVLNYCYDPKDSLIVSIISVPMMLASLLFIPRKLNPFMKLMHKYVIIFFGCLFVSFVYLKNQSSILAAIVTILLYIILIVCMKIHPLRKYYVILLDIIVQLQSIQLFQLASQFYVDQLSFIQYYFSINELVHWSLLLPTKYLLFTLFVGYGFVRIGEPGLMLIFCMVSNSFEALANYGLAILKLIMKNPNNNFEFYFEESSKFHDNRSFSTNSLSYFNYSLCFLLIVVLVLLLYVQENKMKMATGLGNVLVGFYVLFFGVSSYFGLFLEP